MFSTIKSLLESLYPCNLNETAIIEKIEILWSDLTKEEAARLEEIEVALIKEWNGYDEAMEEDAWEGRGL